MHTHTVALMIVPVGLLSSVLKPSAERLENVSSSNGFHAGCEAESVVSAGGPDVFWSWPPSTTPKSTSWAVQGGGASDLQVKKGHKMRSEVKEKGFRCVPVGSTHWLGAASALAPCGCCEGSLTGTPATPRTVTSLGVRWWPRSSVVFGEEGGV